MKPNPSHPKAQSRLRPSGVLSAAMTMSSTLLALMAGFTVAVILSWPG